jgi:hypothetical protein
MQISLLFFEVDVYRRRRMRMRLWKVISSTVVGIGILCGFPAAQKAARARHVRTGRARRLSMQTDAGDQRLLLAGNDANGGCSRKISFDASANIEYLVFFRVMQLPFPYMQEGF